MPSFPFAHVIFDSKDSDRMTMFLKNLGKVMGKNYSEGAVPHGVCGGKHGTMIVPSKIYVEKGIGSGDLAGHIVCKTEEEFLSADFNYCISKLEKVLFRKEEINLENFVD